MSVSNLTNTKWRLNDILNFTNTYTQTFSIDFWNAGGVGMWYKQLRLFYASGEGFGNRLDYNSKSRDIWEAVYGYSPTWRRDEDKTIFIRGGTDVTNATLIAWLEANATQIELDINDLTNTVWHFNGTLLIPYLVYIPSIQEYGIKTFNLNFEYNNQQYTSLRWWQDTDFARMSLDFGETYIADDSDEIDLVIKISGGTDVTDPFLINWLLENAQQILIKTFDLSTLQLSAGTHTIRVRARAQGYRDSNFSNSVSYSVSSDVTVTLTYSHSGWDLSSVYYSTDNGETWIPYPTSTTTIQASQIKFKVIMSNNASDGHSGTTLYLNGTQLVNYMTEGTHITDNVSLNSATTVLCGEDYQCFAEDTKIKLADGTDKLVQDITYDDELLVWDFYEGKLTKAKPCWIKITQEINHYSEITLDNGTVMRLVGPYGHRLFCIEKQKMMYSNKLVGFHVYTLNGVARVLSCKNVQEHVKYYNLTTGKYLDCFADGVLTGSRLNNMYHINNMKYDSNERLISKEEEAERWAVRERYRKC